MMRTSFIERCWAVVDRLALEAPPPVPPDADACSAPEPCCPADPESPPRPCTPEPDSRMEVSASATCSISHRKPAESHDCAGALDSPVGFAHALRGAENHPSLITPIIDHALIAFRPAHAHEMVPDDAGLRDVEVTEKKRMANSRIIASPLLAV